MARPRQIDRHAVLRASMTIADRDGLDALTMQAVADRLGVTPMALYRHVANKSDLLDGVVESLLEEIPALEERLPWPEQLASMGRAMRATARRHPTVFPLLLHLPVNTPAARGIRDRVYSALRDAGVPDDEVARVERLVSTAILGFAASEVSGRFRDHSRKTLDEDYKALEDVLRAGLASYVREAMTVKTR